MFASRMWLGVLWIDHEDRGAGEGDEQVLLAYQPDRVFRMAGPLAGLANAAVTMREAAASSGERLDLPRCPHCAADLGAPDVDAHMGARCGSS